MPQTDSAHRPKLILAPLRRTGAGLIFVALVQGSAVAEEGWFERAGNRLTKVYSEGNTEIYLPLRTHHFRFAYSREKIDRFQESPAGFGIGRGLYDSDGDHHGVYAFGFQDSHFKPQWTLGYRYQTYWRPGGDWKLGAGYTAFLMARTDMAHYTPIPAILPVASVSYRKVAVEATFLPGGRGFGNIIFFSGRYEFDR